MSTSLDAARPETAPDKDSGFRPAIHFTAKDTWLNDPNGLVFHDGLYHLFFQNNPSGNVWGNMSWGHATSTDLLHWTELPVAIACDEREDIFSGSVVVDHGNTSGFGTADALALVAIYTSAFKPGTEYSGTQAQSLAYSTDSGMTWQKYGGNPVLTRGSAHFRDPKVFRYEGGGDAYWVMVAVEAQQQKVVLYRSDDLKSWDFLSEFGPANADGGEWECPDLFPLALDGDPADTRWVLIVNVNPGAVAGGSGGQYFVGQFDGVRFVPDAATLAAPAGLSALPDAEARTEALQHCLWLDWGRDCYASVSFSNVPGGRRIIIGWMSNWDYANELPTSPWRSAMTLPRELRLVTVGGSPRLVQEPVLPELPAGSSFEPGDPSFSLPDAEPGSALVIDAETRLEGEGLVEFMLFGSRDGTQGTYLRYDPTTARLTLDRRESGNTGFHQKFPSVESAPLELEDGLLKLLIVADHCSVEVFAQDGRVVLTDLVFPDVNSLENRLTVTGGRATLLKLAVSKLS
ncbi:glycoside hydrolase family 32 protein [Paenarthrobacter ureafaciens]|uniref:glycoside hydrolase family 32 protein n=1 Tax=Paenarthrobacter ureafaciens TaxID=37931 RepID=UPI0014078F95|nr:glycoside hydrolase family 32 protein [Paenarthrobacter ureafaciens]MCX8454488.1 glycoside hydrolase family 32 protein [Paenarthrobacter ureafaciens]MCY0974237.1 glycoside hydrolase family 32 protein [Paenarthrobacter ureafaciens]